MATTKESLQQQRTAYVRLATREDVHIANALIHGLTRDHDTECLMTESALKSELLRRPPLEGLTIFLLELALPTQTNQVPHRAEEAQKGLPDYSLSGETASQVTLRTVDDLDSDLFCSPTDETRTVVGHIGVIPSYFSRAAAPALRIEDLYIRDAYRRQGLGSILLRAVSQIATKQGIGRIEWNVHAENLKAIKFYEAMGATILQDRRAVKLLGEALQACSK